MNPESFWSSETFVGNSALSALVFNSALVAKVADTDVKIGSVSV